MADCVRRDEVLSYLRDLLNRSEFTGVNPEIEIATIEAIPAFDVSSGRRGTWVDVTDRPKRWLYDCVLECSLCGERVADDRYKYCPNCGAKMEAGEK